MRKVKAETIPMYRTLAEEVITLSETAELKISVTQKAGEDPYIDMRIWVEGESYSGPTKKGFSIPQTEVKTLKAILTKMEKVKA